MSIPDAAIEAAAQALVINPTAQHPDASKNLTAARAAIEAAIPAIEKHFRSVLSEEVLSAIDSQKAIGGQTFDRGATWAARLILGCPE